MARVRRRWIVMAGLLALTIAGCGGNPTASPSAPASAAPTGGPTAAVTAGPTPVASAAPSSSPSQPATSGGPTTPPGSVASDVLTFAIGDDPTSLAGAPSDRATRWVTNLLHAPLYRLNARFEAVPWLAAALPSVGVDGMTWSVTLRDGARFGDGSPITAEDVKMSYDLVLSRSCMQDPVVCQTIQDTVDSVTVSGDRTIVLKLRQKYAPLLETGLTAVPILPAKAVEESFARLEGGLRNVTPAEVSALADGITAALSDQACLVETPPASCAPETYVAQVEAILGRASLQLPDQAAFTQDDGTVDAYGYAQALLDELNALSSTLGAADVDRMAASLNLLDYARRPVGAGPYVFESYTPGDRVVMARNPYWLRTPVAPEKAVAIISSSASAATALQQGDLAWLPEVDPEMVATMQSDPNVKVSTFAGTDFFYIAFNMHDGRIYRDPNLRRAFAMCIDHDGTVGRATEGQGIPIVTPRPPGSWMANPDLAAYARDVQGARKLIEQSGWKRGADGVYAKGGKRLSTDLWVREGRPQRAKFAQLAKAQLRDCGIEVRVREVAFEPLMPLLAFPNNFDTLLGGDRASLNSAFDDYSILHSSQCTTKDLPNGDNFVCWRNAEADKLLEQERTEHDPARRQEIYRGLDKLIRDDVPYYYLWYDAGHRGYSNRLSAQHPEEVDTTSPLDWWNQDAWVVAPR
jgi:ABC-type transport system substrate-binding protein